MPASFEIAGLVLRALPFPDDFGDIVGGDKFKVAVYAVNIVGLKRFDNVGHDLFVLEEVVGIENADNVARCHAQAFVHRVIKPFVFFADQT